MHDQNPNYTILVNWGVGKPNPRGFGCAKACDYCNWRGWSRLPYQAQSSQQVAAFIASCRKSTVSISGGAEPLYRLNENMPKLLAMIGVIRDHGLQTRVITREVQHVAKLDRIADRFSISLDAGVLADLPRYQHEWTGMDVEYSLVLPPLPTEQLQPLMPQYTALHRRLGRRLVLRENLNSLFAVDFSRLSAGHRGIVFVPKSLCLAGRYLATQEWRGHEILLDHQKLFEHLMNDPRIHIFGGAVKHMLSATVHSEFTAALQPLQERFGYQFREVSGEATSYPRYYLGKSNRAGKSIHLVLLKTSADARRFILSAQYDIDRVGYSNGRFYFDDQVSETSIRQALQRKHATAVDGPRDLTLFSANRPSIEARHRIKLVRRGFAIHDNHRNQHYASNHFCTTGGPSDSGDHSAARLL
jgi:hypothetical protein